MQKLSDRILHVYHDYAAADPDERRRNNTARKTWGGENVERLPFVATRTSRDIGDERSLPYVMDMFDYACNRAGEDDIILWTNLDACLMPGSYDEIRRHLIVREACFSGRLNVDDASVPPRQWQMAFNPGHPGTDLIAFRPRWWRRVHRDMFDAFLACEAFDAALVQLIKRDCDGHGGIEPRIVYHESHGQAHWERNPDGPANRHNNLLAARFASKCGLSVTPSKRAEGLFDVDWDGQATWGPTEAHLRFDGHLKPHIHECYVETGVGHGYGIKAALEAGFDRCIGIDCDPQVIADATRLFGADATVLHGDSAKLLPELIGPGRPIDTMLAATFFLDAALPADRSVTVCPLLSELRAITSANWFFPPVIIIDDSDCYVRERWSRRGFDKTFRPADWPTIQQIREALPGYEIVERGTMFVCEMIAPPPNQQRRRPFRRCGRN